MCLNSLMAMAMQCYPLIVGFYLMRLPKSMPFRGLLACVSLPPRQVCELHNLNAWLFSPSQSFSSKRTGSAIDLRPKEIQLLNDIVIYGVHSVAVTYIFRAGAGNIVSCFVIGFADESQAG